MTSNPEGLSVVSLVLSDGTLMRAIAKGSVLCPMPEILQFQTWSSDFAFVIYYFFQCTNLYVYINVG